jgi:beta-glucosidase
MEVNFDFIGIQFYTRDVVKYNWLTPYVKAKIVPADKR